jgi:hypothetical protein
MTFLSSTCNEHKLRFGQSHLSHALDNNQIVQYVRIKGKADQLSTYVHVINSNLIKWKAAKHYIDHNNRSNSSPTSSERIQMRYPHIIEHWFENYTILNYKRTYSFRYHQHIQKSQ